MSRFRYFVAGSIDPMLCRGALRGTPELSADRLGNGITTVLHCPFDESLRCPFIAHNQRPFRLVRHNHRFLYLVLNGQLVACDTKQ
jgi:hypothetical protein